MISNSASAENTAVLDISSSSPTPKTRKKRAGKVQLPAGSEAWLAARFFHPVKAVQKDLFSYLVCHRREFCTWLKQEYAGSQQNQQPDTGTGKIFRPEKLFDGMSGFTICVFNLEAGITPTQPMRVISNHPFVALPPANARFKVISAEVIFSSLQEVLGLAHPTSPPAVKRTILPEQHGKLVPPNLGWQKRKLVVTHIQTRQISLTDGANMLGVSTRTISRLRARGDSSYSPVADYQIFCELLGRNKRKAIAARYGITERTVWNVYQRVMLRLLELLVPQSK